VIVLVRSGGDDAGSKDVNGFPPVHSLSRRPNFATKDLGVSRIPPGKSGFGGDEIAGIDRTGFVRAALIDRWFNRFIESRSPPPISWKA
jgi:hypothetical protein